MKKLVLISIVAALLLGSGAVFGQEVTVDASHDVRVVIPEVVMIRLTNGASNDAVTDDTEVTFDLSSFTADDLVGTHEPDNVSAWDDVKVFVNRNVTWTVQVEVSQTAGPVDEIFLWDKISVTPSEAGLADPFTLSDGTEIASSAERGWQSLGFGQADFALELDGTEVVGDYTASVTYVLTAP